MSILKQGKNVLKAFYRGNPILDIYRIGKLYSLLGGLTQQTKAAIIAAFGKKEGKQILNATIRYTSKHPSIVPFINEDPMLVCSLGLQVPGVDMPIRWLDNGGLAYIDTGYIGNKTIRWELDYVFVYLKNKTPNIQNGAGVANDSTRFCAIFVPNNKLSIAIGRGFYSTTQNSVYGIRNKFVLDAYNKYGMINDERIETGNTFVSSSTNICIFTRNENGNTTSYLHHGRCAESLIKINETEVQHLLPFIRQGVNGMIDTLTGTFYPNANSSGSFSIEYTLPDGTPWQPLTEK